MTGVEERLVEAGLTPAEARRKRELFADVETAFRRQGAPSGEALRWFVPGRIEVLGKHTDYAGGRSLLCAVGRGFCVAASPRARPDPARRRRGPEAGGRGRRSIPRSCPPRPAGRSTSRPSPAAWRAISPGPAGRRHRSRERSAARLGTVELERSRRGGLHGAVRGQRARGAPGVPGEHPRAPRISAATSAASRTAGPSAALSGEPASERSAAARIRPRSSAAGPGRSPSTPSVPSGARRAIPLPDGLGVRRGLERRRLRQDRRTRGTATTGSRWPRPAILDLWNRSARREDCEPARRGDRASRRARANPQPPPRAAGRGLLVRLPRSAGSTSSSRSPRRSFRRWPTGWRASDVVPIGPLVDRSQELAETVSRKPDPGDGPARARGALSRRGRGLGVRRRFRRKRVGAGAERGGRAVPQALGRSLRRGVSESDRAVALLHDPAGPVGRAGCRQERDLSLPGPRSGDSGLRPAGSRRPAAARPSGWRPASPCRGAPRPSPRSGSADARHVLRARRAGECPAPGPRSTCSRRRRRSSRGASSSRAPSPRPWSVVMRKVVLPRYSGIACIVVPELPDEPVDGARGLEHEVVAADVGPLVRLAVADEENPRLCASDVVEERLLQQRVERHVRRTPASSWRYIAFRSSCRGVVRPGTGGSQPDAHVETAALAVEDRREDVPARDDADAAGELRLSVHPLEDRDVGVGAVLVLVDARVGGAGQDLVVARIGELGSRCRPGPELPSSRVPVETALLRDDGPEKGQERLAPFPRGLAPERPLRSASTSSTPPGLSLTSAASAPRKTSCQRRPSVTMTTTFSVRRAGSAAPSRGAPSQDREPREGLPPDRSSPPREVFGEDSIVGRRATRSASASENGSGGFILITLWSGPSVETRMPWSFMRSTT